MMSLDPRSLSESSNRDCRREPGNEGAVPAGDGGSTGFAPGRDGTANWNREDRYS